MLDFTEILHFSRINSHFSPWKNKNLKFDFTKIKEHHNRKKSIRMIMTEANLLGEFLGDPNLKKLFTGELAGH